jgi:glycosyltransferase involved in cell wall biosynthesis
MPLLTIAIPTWNRVAYLEQCLTRLHDEAASVDPDALEILVCDNASSDATPDILHRFENAGLRLKVIRNSENIGSDRNIAQCFNQARGDYILILGDDDLLCRGTLDWLVARAAEKKFGVICFKPYGFNTDAEDERPYDSGRDMSFTEAGRFLRGIGSLSTLISSCIVRKSALNGVDAETFVGDNLVQVHLVMRAAIASEYNLYSTKRRVACGRNYSVAYDFFDIFVRRFGLILDDFRGNGLDQLEIRKIENSMLVRFFPVYLLRLRLDPKSDVTRVKLIFDERFTDQIVYFRFIEPILSLPRPLAIIWAIFATIFGRLSNGDLDLGIAHLAYRSRRIFRSKKPQKYI